MFELNGYLFKYYGFDVGERNWKMEPESLR